MAREYFHNDEKKLLNRLQVLQSLITEQKLHDKPCPLLASQLNEMSVICNKLLSDLHQMSECVKTALKESPTLSL